VTKSKSINSLEPAVSRRQLMLIGAGIATVGVAASLIYSFTRPQRADAVAKGPRRRGGKLSPAELTKPGTLPEIVVGKADAPVTIVEYADLTCPACAAFHTTVLPSVKEKYLDTGKAKLIFREFPTNTPAMIAFMTVRCVAPDRAPPLISALFSHQEDWRGAASFDQLREKLFAYGQQVGLTRQAFNTCVPSAKNGKIELTPSQQKLAGDISSVRERGNEGFGVNATPTFFVNGKKLTGASLEDFDKAINP
jgi:protein-disulfide isomerase